MAPDSQAPGTAFLLHLITEDEVKARKDKKYVKKNEKKENEKSDK